MLAVTAEPLDGTVVPPKVVLPLEASSGLIAAMPLTSWAIICWEPEAAKVAVTLQEPVVLAIPYAMYGLTKPSPVLMATLFKLPVTQVEVTLDRGLPPPVLVVPTTIKLPAVTFEPKLAVTVVPE